MVMQVFSNTMSKVFGSRNDRMIKRYSQRVARMNDLEPGIRKLTDAQLRAKTAEFTEQLKGGKSLKETLPEILAVAREAMDRYVGIRNIFNPEMNFDPTRLPERLQPVYAEIRAKADAMEPEAVKGGDPAPGYLQVEVPNEMYDAVRELYPESRPPFRARPFDVQLIGGMVLGEGRIAEMRTGEGKTIVAPLACYVACCEGLSCHVVTVNDYLVQRDRDWVFPFYYGLGLTVGAIHPMHMQPPPLKKAAYECNVLYATNSELGFDYLRDNMKLSVQEQVQRQRDFVIIDEVDSILIDEARTPLIISGQKDAEKPPYELADEVARHLADKQRPWQQVDDKVKELEKKIKGLEGDIRNTRDKASVPKMKEQIKSLAEQMFAKEAERDQHIQYYEVEPEKKAAHLTHEGVAEAQKKAGIGSFYVGENMEFPHLLENALRAHAIYNNNKEYVVHNGEIVIVDEFTGRMMVGRQWSDGLHQAIECKEKVKIKEETQTLATVTIQNFFKLYKRLAGMTGTAITEATEFMEIYQLDVVAIPTNRPIARVDRNDLIFLAEKDKWSAILDEIKRVHDIGRPVLVGTTSVEASEMLSQLLTRKYGIKHSVLNAKQHERESNIVEDAGQLGSVMIATNMAGRGTDIKLRAIPREELIRHWQARNLLTASANAEMSDDELLTLAYRQIAQQHLGLKKKDAEARGADELKLALFRHWLVTSGLVAEKKAEAMSVEDCADELDALGDYDLLRLGIYQQHRLKIYTHTEQMGGLHIVGTERHESRRIDNQLRGRSGRQGDNGSSRFFLSLEDSLMKMFAGDRMLTILSKLGMKEGDAIEHSMVSRSVERAQRKVEQRNYEIRKNLLEYDEVMEHQRGFFYGVRQDALEGKRVQEMIFDYIAEAIDEATATYLDKGYPAEQVAEWARSQLEVSIDPAKLYLQDADELERTLRKNAQEEVIAIVDVTLGEYMSDDMMPEDWDLKGLSDWAKSRFNVNLPKNRLADMNVAEVRGVLIEEAQAYVAAQELTGMDKYLDPQYGAKQLGKWVDDKFNFQIDIEKVTEMAQEKEGLAEIADMIIEKARAAYAVREVEVPARYQLETFEQGVQQDPGLALGQLHMWAEARFKLGLAPDGFAKELSGDTNEISSQRIYEWMRDQLNDWLKEGGKLEAEVQEQAGKLGDGESVKAYLKERFGQEVSDEELEQYADDLAALIDKKGRATLRAELTMLERGVLLQTLDQAWKDHLYGMDQLKSSINLRGYAEKDPKIEYKREGAEMFRQMQSTIRDRVTELSFRAKLTPNVRFRNAWGGQQTAQHPDARGAQGRPAQPPTAAGAPAQSSPAQRRDLDAADRAGSEEQRPVSRKQRRARAARKRKGK